jgi:GNAT superfamily N-acetyltransferase
MVSHISLNGGIMVEYRIGGELDLKEVIDVYNASTLGERRPTQFPDRMAAMMKHANLIVTAWDGPKMVGIARSFTDFAYVTYMSDLAVRTSHQRQGIGKELIKKTQEEAGAEATLLLTAAPAAEEYYPRIGFVNVPQCWILPAKDKLDYYRKIGATARTNWKLE